MAKSTNSRSARPRRFRVLTVSALIAATLGVSACVPLAATGIALGAIAVIDRRTIGAQTEDQAIELKSVSELRRYVKDTTGIAVTSFNRRVLLTGQVSTGADKQNAGAVIAGLANVRGVYNELDVKQQSSFTGTATDTTLTTKVKTVLLRDRDVPGNSIKVKTEDNIVYLMGLVTNGEAQAAAQLTSRVAGVQRVITVFEILSDTDAQRLNTWARPTIAPSQAPARTAAAPAPAPAFSQQPIGQQPIGQQPVGSANTNANSRVQQAPAVGAQVSPTGSPSVSVQRVTPNVSSNQGQLAPNQSRPQPVRTPLVSKESQKQ